MTEIAAPTTIEARPAVPPVEAQPVPAPHRRSRRSAAQGFENGRYPYSSRMGRRAYEAEKALLQAELLKVQL